MPLASIAPLMGPTSVFRPSVMLTVSWHHDGAGELAAQTSPGLGEPSGSVTCATAVKVCPT